MEPLGVVASITGILTAAAKVSSILMQIQDADNTTSAILTEVSHIRIVFTAFQKFIGRNVRLSGIRAALVQLDDVVVILTQTVLVFAELQDLVAPFSSGGRFPAWRRLIRPRHEVAALRLLSQLQRHKTSLTLLLQIIQW
jgi:hypothetical protein